MPWTTLGTPVRLIDRNLPPNGCFTNGYLVFKVEIRALNVAFQVNIATGEDTLTLQRSLSTSRPTNNAIELRITNDLTASLDLSDDCLQNTRDLFTRGSAVSIRRRFLDSILHCCGLKYKWRISETLHLSFSFSPDSNMCFFGTQLQINYNTDPFAHNVAGTERDIRLAINGNVTLRFGLTRAGWMWLWERTGARGVQLLRGIPNAVQIVLGTTIGTAAVIVVGTVACTFLLVWLMADLLAWARSNGEFLRNCINYAAGYVDALSGPEFTRGRISRQIDDYRLLQRGYPARINGYIDALQRAVETSYTETRSNLLQRIGMGAALRVVEPDGTEYNISRGRLVLSIRPFQYQTRQYIIGALVHLLREGEPGHQRIPCPV